MTPSVLDIAPDLRLVRPDAPPIEALSWYQDPETLWMVDGKREPYTPEHLAQMYDWLSARGELWFIEVRDEGAESGRRRHALPGRPSHRHRREEPAVPAHRATRDRGARRAGARPRLARGPRGRNLRLERRVPAVLLGRRL